MDYTEAILKDVLCQGLGDTEIQLDLLGDKNQDMTMEQVLRFVEAKEAGKRSASRLLLPQATDALSGSSYKKQKRPPPKEQETCTYCGTKGHGRSPPTRIRRTECPAFDTTCNHCGKEHHLREYAESRTVPSRQKPRNGRMLSPTHYAASRRWTTQELSR